MSGINGDKARFHRQRKNKIARRKRNLDLMQHKHAQPKSRSHNSGAATSRPVSA